MSLSRSNRFSGSHQVAAPQALQKKPMPTDSDYGAQRRYSLFEELRGRQQEALRHPRPNDLLIVAGGKHMRTNS